MAETNRKVIAVDLDGTLAKKESPFSVYSVGEPVPEMLAKVRQARADGHRVILFTARASSNDPGVHRAVREWLLKHDLGDVKITCQKTPDISEIWDDRARGVVPDQGEFTDDKSVTQVNSPDICPKCGGSPESMKPDDAGDVTCSKCSWMWEPQSKAAAEHHCEINTCPECDGVSSCRCRNPKTVKTSNVCFHCQREAAGDPPMYGREAALKRKAEKQQAKEAAQMVRKTRMVEQHDDHCPHCDVQFREKFYPRPDHEQAKREGIPLMEADELCPNCKGIVDRPEMSDDDIENCPWSGDDFKQELRDQRQRRRDRIAARESKKVWDSACAEVRGMFKGAAEQDTKAPDAQNAHLIKLRLRRGECPDCGTAPEGANKFRQSMGLSCKCDKCGKDWNSAEMLHELRDKSKGPACPKCGSMDTYRKSVHEDTDMEEVVQACHACRHRWEPTETKQASEELEVAPKIAVDKIPTKFLRPENPDKYKDVGNVEFWCGSNDWEDSNTWIWAVKRNYPQDIPGGEMVWVALKYPGYPHPGDDGITRAQALEMRDIAKKIRQAWVTTAQDIARRRAEVPEGVDMAPSMEDVWKALDRPELNKYVLAKGQIDNSEPKQASAAKAPTTGPHAIMRALASLDLDAMEAKARQQIASGKVTQRDAGVKMLNVLHGLKRNELSPTDLMINRVPVIPPAFRPFSLMGSTYIPGAANELYADLFKHIDVHRETLDTLGDAGAAATRINMRNAVRALYGYGDPVSPKLQQRGTQGFLHRITDKSPKFGYVLRRLVSKPIDSVGRSVITVAPDLDMNQIGLPRSMAWDLYGSLIQRRLARSGMGVAAAIKHVKDQSREATLALEQELKERPVIYSRAPAWHKFNTIAGYAQLHDGDDIRINPYVTAGHNADFDGDQINVNVPILDDSVQEAKEKLMPDKMLFSIKNPDEVMPNIKHESLLSLAAAQHRPATMVHNFNSESEALAAIRRGDVKLHDEINYPS